MKYSRNFLVSVFSAFVFSLCITPTLSAETVSEVNFEYVKIYADKDGETHFKDMTIPYESQDYAPPAPPIGVMARQAATGFLAITTPPGYVSDLHPAPRVQWMIITSGTAEIIVSDGEKRILPTGSILYLEEIGSKGHLTNVIGDEQLILMVVEVD